MKDIHLLHGQLVGERSRGSKCDCILSEAQLIFPIDSCCMRLLSERERFRMNDLMFLVACEKHWREVLVPLQLERSRVDEFPLIPILLHACVC